MKKVLVPLMILLIVVLITGCSSANPTSSSIPQASATTTAATSTAAQATTVPATSAAPSTPKMGGIFKVILISSPSSPGGVPWELTSSDTSSMQYLFEPLFRGTPNGELVPWLVDTYKIADDHLSITMTLKQGIKFTDGSDFNAEVAKWNLDQRIEKKKVSGWKSVDLIDAYTIRLNVIQWKNTLLTDLQDSNSTWMISKAAYEKNGVDWARMNPVGTGPFKFSSFQKDAYYKFVKNESYWIKGKPYLDGVEVLYITDQVTQETAMRSHEANLLEIDPGLVGYNLVQAGFEYLGSIYATHSLVFDTAVEKSVFTDKRVREAVEYAIDREAIAEAFSYGLWDAPYQIPGPGTGNVYNPDFQYARKYDPAKSKQLLAEAGKSAGFQCTIVIPPVPLDKSIMVAVQADLKKVNIEAELVYCTDMGQYLNYIYGNASPSTLTYIPVSPIGSFNAYLAYAFPIDMTTANVWNKNWARTPEYIAAYKKTMESLTEDQLLVRACTDIMSKDCSVMPLLGSGKGWIVDATVRDAGFFTRCFAPWWTSETAWLDK